VSGSSLSNSKLTGSLVMNSTTFSNSKLTGALVMQSDVFKVSKITATLILLPAGPAATNLFVMS